MTRLKPVRAYWRRVPDPRDTPPHIELEAAYRRDLLNADIQEWLALELEREREEAR